MKNKLRMDVDALHVESFDVREEAAPRRGTVRAKQSDCAMSMNSCGPSLDQLCQWTTDPQADCWRPTWWDGCSCAC